MSAASWCHCHSFQIQARWADHVPEAFCPAPCSQSAPPQIKKLLMDSCILTFLSWISVNNEMHDGGIHLAASLSCCCQTVTVGTPVPFPIITRQNVCCRQRPVAFDCTSHSAARRRWTLSSETTRELFFSSTDDFLMWLTVGALVWLGGARIPPSLFVSASQEETRTTTTILQNEKTSAAGGKCLKRKRRSETITSNAAKVI